MATTSIHLPPDLLEQLDRIANDRGVSRNRVIVESCRVTVQNHRGRWPEGFVEGDQLTDDDLELLRGGADGFLADLLAARVNRAEAPF